MRLIRVISISVAFLLASIAFSRIAIASPLTSDELAPPRITSPLYKGAEIVEVWGFTPNAELRIYANGSDIGGGSCWYSKCNYQVSQLSASQKITATQKVSGITSSPTRDEYVVTVEEIPDKFLDPKYKNERIIAPSIDTPLTECQKIVPVKNVIQGALVQVFSPDASTLIGKTNTPWDYARVYVPTALVKGQKIQANQNLFFSDPSDLSSPAVQVKAKPTELPIPEINQADLVVGSTTITIRNLWIGAKVDIYYEEAGKTRVSIGGGYTSWSGTIFPVKSLTAAWVGCNGCIKADQSLCDLKATSVGGTVKNSLDAPSIGKPICAGSSEVTVCTASSNPILKLFLKGNPDKQISQLGTPAGCTSVNLGDTLSLKNQDEVYAVQTVGTLESKSDTVKVVDTSDPVFKIGKGTYCKTCSGQDSGPTFVRDTLTKLYGPEFTATMCGTEKAVVEIWGPKGTLIETITLEEIPGKKGYFTGTWDWDKIGWNTSTDIPIGMYTAKFKIWPSGGTPTEQKKYFHVFTQGCVELEVLCAHNSVRDQVKIDNPSVTKLDSLTWSDSLGSGAQKWADYLVKSGTFVHDSNRGSVGENIYSGSSSYTAAVDLWASEKVCFQNKAMPDIYNHNSSKCDANLNNPNTSCTQYKDWHCAGHYSQIVWRKTLEVGCGMASGIVVCRYSPSGNYTGDTPY